MVDWSDSIKDNLFMENWKNFDNVTLMLKLKFLTTKGTSGTKEIFGFNILPSLVTRQEIRHLTALC